jgi:hypothetical protein
MIENNGMSGIDPKQEQLISALLREKSKRDAARKAGIPESTMYRWFAEKGFKAAWRAAQRAVFDDGLVVLKKNTARAAQALADELDKDTATGSACVISAAKAILDHAFHAQSELAVEEELAELRILMAKLKAGQPMAAPVPISR